MISGQRLKEFKTIIQLCMKVQSFQEIYRFLRWPIIIIPFEVLVRLHANTSLGIIYNVINYINNSFKKVGRI